MTYEQHPITPPPELVKKWITESRFQDYCSATEYTIAQAARWGADQELEECCEWLDNEIGAVDPFDLRAARRPKPPSLKEQALALIRSVEVSDDSAASWDFSVVRLALESLPD